MQRIIYGLGQEIFFIVTSQTKEWRNVDSYVKMLHHYCKAQVHSPWQKNDFKDTKLIEWPLVFSIKKNVMVHL